MTPGRRCVLCVGNELCEDDGIGLVLGRILTRNRVFCAEVALVPELSLAVLDHFLGCSRMVVVDALVRGGAPGRVSLTRYPSEQVSPSCAVGHATSLSSLLELCTRLRPAGERFEVVLVGIEPKAMRPFVDRLSAPVRAAIPRALRLILGLLGGARTESDRGRRHPCGSGIRRRSPRRTPVRFHCGGTPSRFSGWRG
jgi:hydrogenase maturation protease